MNLVITEIFYSLQGEGPFIGMPSVFIRLGGCIEPLCPWCDTDYAWHDFKEISITDITARLSEFGCINVVITGGEPFLQWNCGLKELHDVLCSAGFQIHYETSGKVEIPGIEGAVIVLSPKNINGKWHIQEGNISRASHFKFIADGLESLLEIDRFVKDHNILKELVYIMPQGKTRKEQLSKMETVFSFCKDHGYHMTPRLHILTFDNNRGV